MRRIGDHPKGIVKYVASNLLSNHQTIPNACSYLFGFTSFELIESDVSISIAIAFCGVLSNSCFSFTDNMPHQITYVKQNKKRIVEITLLILLHSVLYFRGIEARGRQNNLLMK